MRQGEDVVADAAAVRMVDGNAEIGFVIKQPVYDVCRFARGRDGCRVERRVARRDVGVEQRGWFAPVAVPGIVGARGLASPGGQERLTIGTGDIGEPEPRRERLALLGIDHHGRRPRPLDPYERASLASAG